MPTATMTRKEATALEALKAKLAALDEQARHTEAQLAACHSDADAAYASRDHAALSRLFARQDALTAQRQDYATERAAVADAIRAAVAPRVAALVQAATDQAAGWVAARDAALADAQAAADALVAAVARLATVPTADAYRAILSGWQQRLASLEAEAGVSLARPDWPDVPSVSLAAMARIQETVKPLATAPRLVPGLVRLVGVRLGRRQLLGAAVELVAQRRQAASERVEGRRFLAGPLGGHGRHRW